jgi:hypothetical protein
MWARAIVAALATAVAGGWIGQASAGGDPGSRDRRIQHLAFAGPALAGGAVVWGEEYRDGSLAVIRRRPGRGARVVHRIAAPSGRDRERSFLGLPGALSASPSWIAYGLDDAKVTVDGDQVSSEAHSLAFGARDGGVFHDLLPGCDDAAYIATASEGDAVAIGQTHGSCGDEEATRVWLIDGDAAPRLIYQAPGPFVAMRQVQLAGRWIAWSEGGLGAGDRQITVADRAGGSIAARLTPRDFAGGSSFSAFDIDAAGNVVALGGPQPRCYYVCVTWRNIGGGPAHTISRRALDGRVAIANGRIAYVTIKGLHPRRLIVADLAGKPVRRLGRFSRTRRPIGDLALSGNRIAWGVLSTDGDLVPGAPGTIRTARLPGHG